MERVLAQPFAIAGIRRRAPAAGAWTLGFAPIALLAFEGGGYDTVVRSQAGIAIWWLLALGCLIGGLRLGMPSRRALVAVSLLAALGAWTWIGTAASESPERTLAEVARVATYLGVLLLGLMALDRRSASAAIAGVASAVGLIALLAVLSRLQPEIFPTNETGEFLPIAQHRLNWPLNYWNGLAALCAIGVPLLLALAAAKGHAAVRGLAAAVVPVVALCIDLTVSRGGIAATAVAVIVLVALAPDRIRLLGTLAITGIATAILVAAAAQRGLVHEDLAGDIALRQGDELTMVIAVVAAGAGLLQVGFGLLESLRDPARSPVSPQQARIAGVVVAILATIGAVAAGIPDRMSDAWDEFSSPAAEAQIAQDHDASRLGSLSSNGRAQLWDVALDSLRAHPAQGTGPGTYEFAWLRDTTIGGTVRDVHSFYLELGAEAGVLGLALGLAFVLALLSAGWTMRRFDSATRTTVAAALAGVSAFSFSAGLDWTWEMPVIPIAVLLLAAAAFACARTRDESSEEIARVRPSLPRRRIASAVATLIPIGLLATVLASASSVEASRASARSGSLPAALEHAIDAHNANPGAVTPLLQSALVRETAGDLSGAAADAREATLREPSNWRTWLTLSRLQARLGDADSSVVAFRRARTLNPNHPIFR